MISVDAGQATLASKATIRQVVLVRIRTFTDYAAETVDETFYLSTLPVFYQWTAPTPVQFEPLIREVSPIIRGIPHIPDGQTLATRDGLVLELDATERAGSSLWVRMQAKQLVGARVDVATLLVEESRWSGDDWVDLSDLGAVATVRWRGEVTSVPEYEWESGTFTLACDTLEPVLDWPYARDPLTNDPRDTGKRYPIPFGVARSVDLVGREVGHATTLVAAVPDTGTASWSISDGSGFPTSGTGLVKAGDEIVLVNFATSTPTTLAISARAQDGTTAEAHPIGATIVELVREARFVLSAVELQAISALYWQLSDGQRVRLPADAYGFNPGCDALEAGRSLGVVSFDREQLAGALAYVQEVTQQAEYQLGENSIVRLPWTGYGAGNAAATGGSGADDSDWSVSGTTGLFGTYSAGVLEYGVGYTIDTGFDDQVVIRFRPVFDNELTSQGATPTNLRYSVPTETLSGSTITSSGTHAVRTYTGGSTPSRELTPGEWITPSVAGVWTVADMVASGIGDGVRCVMHLRQDSGGGAGSDALVYMASSYWEIEVEPPPVVRTRGAGVFSAWSVGNGLRLVADCNGLVLRSSESAVSSLPFSTTTGWTAVDCSLSVQTVETRQCIRLDSADDVDVGMRFNGLNANWSASGASISFEVYVSSADKDDLDGSAGVAIEMRLISTGGDTTYGFGPADVIDDEWTTLVVDLANHANRSTSGTGANLAAVADFRLGAEWLAGTIPPSGTPEIFFRNVRYMVRTIQQHAADVGRWFVQDLAGLSGAVDGTAYSTAKTNTPDVNLGGDLRRLGLSFAEILARLEFESRISWIQTEGPSGTIFKPQAAQSTYDWPSAARTLDNFRRLTVASRQLDELANEFSALWDYRADFGANQVEAFRELSRADGTVNDASADVTTASILAAQDLVGLRPAEPQEFLAIRTEAALLEVWAYYLAEALRYGGRRFSMTVDYQSGYDLEPGDIVEFETPWDGATVKARVTRTAFPLSEPGVGLSLEEVP